MKALCLLLLIPCLATAAESEGERLYKKQCARCHGLRGEGTKKYKQRLEGDRSVEQLAVLIQKTMPESAPGTLSDKEARVVAGFVHSSFYSKLARERNRPARIELTRLTVRQYRHAVADLIGDFRWQRGPGGPNGLKGEYFKGRYFQPQNRVVERIDPRVAFSFGTDAPIAGKMEPHEFSIRWRGALLAPRTGEYEFTIRTEHAARLWVNEGRKPLIDAWVKSGNDTEYKANLFLVGGRAYSLRLEYTKGKQGVDDSKTNKGKRSLVKSSITLLWKMPHGVSEPIPSRHLSITAAPEAFVCSTPFPPDDRSTGWERGGSVSKEWDQATTDAALATAGYVAGRLDELAGTRENDPERKKKLLAFCLRFAERAFRKPLNAEQKALIERQFAAGKDPGTGVKRVVLVVLKSPRFLFREVGGGLDGFDVASRLSFGLWDSLPDRALLEAAAGGLLSSKEQVVRQAERMIGDPRGRAKLRDFLFSWLNAEAGSDNAKDTAKLPGFDAQGIQDLRSSLELFLDGVVWSDKSDFRELFLSEQVPLNGRLAKLYGVGLPLDATFRNVTLDGGKRAGVVSHPYLMSRFAHGSETSPIHRGVFLARGVLGVALRPPPEAVTPVPANLHPGLTTRERVSLQTRPGSCQTCHGTINPLGFTLEHFDAVGRYRAKDNGKPVDAAGFYQTRDGKTVKMTGARELAAFLASSPEVHAAFAEQLFHQLAQQPVRAYGPTTLDDLRRSFVASGFHIRKLAVEIMVVAALKPRRATTPGEP
jgi:hypothetical protein